MPGSCGCVDLCGCLLGCRIPDGLPGGCAELASATHAMRDSKKGMIGSLGIPKDSKKGMTGTIGLPRGSKNGMIGTLGLPRDSKKGIIGTLGIPKRE